MNSTTHIHNIVRVTVASNRLTSEHMPDGWECQTYTFVSADGSEFSVSAHVSVDIADEVSE